MRSIIVTHSSLAASKSPASAELAVVPSSSLSIAVSSPVAQPFPFAASPTPTTAPEPADALKHASKRDAAFIDEVDEEARADRNIGNEYAAGFMILLRSA